MICNSMSSTTQSSGMDRMISLDHHLAPSGTPVTDVEINDISESSSSCNNHAANSTWTHVHMKLGHVQSRNPSEPSPPPIPPRLIRSSSNVAQSPGPMTSFNRANAAYGKAELQTARSRGKAVRRQRHSSAPAFEEWSIRSEIEAPVVPSASEVEVHQYGNHLSPITLNQLVLQYSHMLPMRVKIIQGCDSVLHTGKIYNIHFVKQLKVVQVKDMAGRKYSIPFNSSAKFGIVYSPAGIRNECYVFEKVKDIIAASELPKVVVATKSLRSNKDNSDNSIMKNEVLIVQEVHKSQLKMNRKLRVFSCTAKVHKKLSSDVYGNFTTNPCKAQLYLPDLLKLFQYSLPLKARLYPDVNAESSLPDILSKEVITLERVSTETSLIASTLSDSGPAGEMIELKTSLPVTVLVEATESEVLYEYTQTLFRNFNPAKVATLSSHTIRSQHASQEKDNYKYEVWPAQEQLYQQVRNAEGVSIIPPKLAKSSPKDENCSDSGNEHSENVSLCPPEHEYQSLNQKELDDSSNYEPIAISPTCSSACSDVFALTRSDSAKSVHPEDFEELKQQCSIMVSEVNQLKVEVATLKEQLAALDEKHIPAHNEDNCSENLKQLIALDNLKILELLDNMNLSEYKEVFSKECITGEILLELDESILTNELCITNRIHRIRLMKIVSGQMSVTKFFSSCQL